MQNIFFETQWRTLGKIISWRVLLTIMNFTYTYVVTGDWRAGLAVAGISAVINSFLYWAHERIWNRVPAGKKAVDTETDVVYK
jgi:uncharacterized membrane protein